MQNYNIYIYLSLFTFVLKNNCLKLKIIINMDYNMDMLTYMLCVNGMPLYILIWYRPTLCT